MDDVHEALPHLHLRMIHCDNAPLSPRVRHTMELSLFLVEEDTIWMMEMSP